MGENPSTVFNVGALGVERVKKIKYSLEKIKSILKIDIKEKFFLLTLHPSTIGPHIQIYLSTKPYKL